MPSESINLEYIKPAQQIYEIAVDKDFLNWKSFLSELIYKEGLNPWDIDLSILTKKYIDSLKELKSIDFDVSGKFITIAVHLLKTKTETLLDRDIRGMDIVIENYEAQGDDFFNGIDSLEDFDNHLDDIEIKKKTEYKLKYRNPIARKRKVTIFDLIKSLEKTFKQSNIRKRNNFLIRRDHDVNYSGPVYNKKPKDLKQLISDLFDLVCEELKTKKGNLHFGNVVGKVESKMDILEKFIPLLHLHNTEKIELSQEKHFGNIKIKEVNNN